MFSTCLAIVIALVISLQINISFSFFSAYLFFVRFLSAARPPTTSQAVSSASTPLSPATGSRLLNDHADGGIPGTPSSIAANHNSTSQNASSDDAAIDDIDDGSGAHDRGCQTHDFSADHIRMLESKLIADRRKVLELQSK